MRTGDAGDGTVNNDSPYAHWTYTYNATKTANSYTCATADGASAYDTYTGVFPWDPSEQEIGDPSEEELLLDDYYGDTNSISNNSTWTNSTYVPTDAELQMSNASFFSAVAGSNK